MFNRNFNLSISKAETIYYQNTSRKKSNVVPAAEKKTSRKAGAFH